MPQSICTIWNHYISCLNQCMPNQSNLLYASRNTNHNKQLRCIPQPMHAIPTNYSPQPNLYMPCQSIAMHTSIYICHTNLLHCMPPSMHAISIQYTALQTICVIKITIWVHFTINAWHIYMISGYPGVLLWYWYCLWTSAILVCYVNKISHVEIPPQLL